MPTEVATWLSATAALLTYLLLLPYTPFVIGALVAGGTWARSKRLSALDEIGRGLFFGVLSGGGAWVIQRVIAQGVV